MNEARESEVCQYCEKVLVELVAPAPFGSLMDVPSTYDAARQTYEWKDYDVAFYAMVPRSITGLRAELEVYICMDEDDLDDIDLLVFVREIVEKDLRARRRDLSIDRVMDSVLAPPKEFQCCRQRHLDA